jgi:hypothetical protein
VVVPLRFTAQNLRFTAKSTLAADKPEHSLTAPAIVLS